MKNTIILFFLAGFFSCSNNGKEGNNEGIVIIRDCKQLPVFISKTGFDPKRSAFSTSEKKIKGLVLIEFPLPGKEKRVYQDSSWKSFGSMGPIVITEKGEIYVAPIPFVNILANDPEKQNIIYRVDPLTGVLKPFTELPTDEKPGDQNPYGILGLGYDCETGNLFASTVMGSTRDKESGSIFSIQTRGQVKILDRLNNMDIMGCGLAYFNGQKNLFFGSTRTPAIYRVTVSDGGKFTQPVQLIGTLQGLGPRGDDKARKIRFSNRGEMLISGVEFNYNLIAPTEKQEMNYTCIFDLNEDKWKIIAVPGNIIR